ncbi:MAG: TetR/AcrR family transcriptional regulator [Proteocatella sp.]
MNNIKMDRRIRKTRNNLKLSLSELMCEKDFKDITVKDIADRADINRGTFYLHYKDTYDLLEKIENGILMEFQDMIDTYRPPTPVTTLLPILEPIADYILDNQEVCRSMFRNKSNMNFIHKFRKLISENGASFIKEKFPSYNKEIYEFYFTFISFGILGQIKHWFDTDLHLPKKDFVEMVDKIITSAAASVLS